MWLTFIFKKSESSELGVVSLREFIYAPEILIDGDG